MNLWKKVLGMAIVGLCVGATQVYAAPITTLYNTGVLDDGTSLASGSSTDVHYTLTVSSDPSFPGSDAIVANPIAVGYWLPNGPSSQWISPSADQAYPSGLGNTDGPYTYQTTFDLAGLDPNTASITGQWASDNGGLDILINGVSTGQTAASYGSFTPFNILTGFNSGTNRIDFATTNFCCSPSSNPTGLRVEFLSATADPAVAGVPEPSSLLLLGSALAGLGLWRKAKARS